MPEVIGDYQYSTKDLIGHGAFAIVYLGRSRTVNILDLHCSICFLFCFQESRKTSCNQTYHEETFSKITKFTRKRN